MQDRAGKESVEGKGGKTVTEKVIKSKIVLEGVDEYREALRLVKEDIKELDASLQSVKNSMEQLAQSVKEFNKLFRQE